MVARQIRVSGIALTLLALVVVLGVWFSCFDSRQARAQPPKDAKLKELLKERHTTLKQIAQYVAKAHQDGGVSIERLHEAEQAVLKAEFDLSDTEKERTAVLEKIVVWAKKYEDVVSKAANNGARPVTVSLKAKVDRLEAEIALERVKSK